MKQPFFQIVFLLLFFSSLNFAQDFDQSFLKSLPANAAEDLLKRSNDQKDLTETQYRRPSTFIEKPDISSNRFGIKVFSMMQSTLMPINEPNYDSSYVLDFGDEVEIQLVGQRSSSTRMVIKSDGSITIKDIGKIYVLGLSLSEASELLKAKVNDSFIGVEAFLTLVNVRDIQVLVTGNVFNPGPYTLNGNSNIFHALSVSGGPSEIGSFRSIDLIRNGNKIESIDLYESLIYGKTIFNTRLRSGDMVFVNPVKNLVSLNGAFKRPGEYEFLEGEKGSIALEFANGISAFADTNTIKLERIVNGRVAQIPIIGIDGLSELVFNDSDILFVREYPFRKVEIRGAVQNPGVYLMNEGDNMFDAIAKSGGYTINAYPFGGVYQSKEAHEINEMAAEELYQDYLDELINLSQSNISNPPILSEESVAITEDLKELDVTGRVIADFINTEQTDPILVKDGDIIIIPEITNQVYVYGEIASEGAALFSEGLDAEYYINKKGGIKKTGDKKAIYVLHPNGESQLLTKNKNIFTNQLNEKIEIYPGSVIFVPRKIDTGYSARMRTQAYVTILGQLGVSLASLSVLKD